MNKHPHIEPMLKAEFEDPISYLDSHTYKSLKHKAKLKAFLYTAGGALLIYFIPLLPTDDTAGKIAGTTARGALILLGVGVLLFVVGVKQFFYLDRSIIQKRRTELLRQHIELDDLVQRQRLFNPTNRRKIPPIRIRLLVYGIAISILVVSITLWAVRL